MPEENATTEQAIQPTTDAPVEAPSSTLPPIPVVLEPGVPTEPVAAVETAPVEIASEKVDDTPLPAYTPTRLPSPEGEANGGQATLAPAQAQSAVATPPLAGGDSQVDTAQTVGNEPQDNGIEPQKSPEQTPSAVSRPSDGAEPIPRGKAESSNKPREFIQSLFLKAKQTIQFRKQKKLDKILAYVEKRGRVNNNEVEKLLHVSDPTASRYLRALAGQGRLIMTGKGKGAYYLKK